MKTIKKALSRKAEGYIDLCILIIVFAMLITLSLNVCKLFTERINMQQAADKVLEEAVRSGLVKSKELDDLIARYFDKNGYEIEISKENEDGAEWVQFGESILVRVRKKTIFEGIGKLFNSDKFSLEVLKDGKSEKYWKR